MHLGPTGMSVVKCSSKTTAKNVAFPLTMIEVSLLMLPLSQCLQSEADKQGRNYKIKQERFMKQEGIN